MRVADLTPGRVYALARRSPGLPRPVLVLSNQNLDLSNDHRAGSVALTLAHGRGTVAHHQRGILVADLDPLRMSDWHSRNTLWDEPETADHVKGAAAGSAVVTCRLPLEPGQRVLIPKEDWPDGVRVVQPPTIAALYLDAMREFLKTVTEEQHLESARQADFVGAHNRVQGHLLAHLPGAVELRAERRGSDVVMPLGHFVALARSLPGRGGSRP